MGAALSLRAHGGQGGIAGAPPRTGVVRAVLRGMTRTVRVWNDPFGRAEDFTIEEARALCARAEEALTGLGFDAQTALLALDEADGVGLITLDRRWLVAFLSAVRGALRTLAVAEAMGGDRAGRAAAVIDNASDPGSWARHLRHMEALR